MGVIKLVIFGVVGLIILLGAIGGIYYASDGTVEATVIDKQCSATGGTGEITVKTKFPVPGIEYTLTEVDNTQCRIVQNDNYVRYYLKSERTSIWNVEGGSCLWDTEHGANGCDV